MNRQLSFIWIFLILVSEVILLVLPVYDYDKNLMLILVIGFWVQLWFINRFKKDFKKITKSVGLRAIPFVLAVFNLINYQNRREHAFENNKLQTTEATIVKRYSQGGGRTTQRFYLQYKFFTNSRVYEHVDEVKYWVWFYYKYHNELLIDYVVDNPRISRINKSSLIKQPNREEIMKKANQEYNRMKLGKETN